MATRTIICREHGGRLVYQATRGRQPVRCGGERGPCDKAEYKVGDTVTVGGIQFTKHSEYPSMPSEQQAYATSKGVAPVESNGNVRKSDNPSLPLAQAAKERLVALGWTVEGKAWIETYADLTEVPAAIAALTAQRGDETITMTWVNGAYDGGDYSLNYERPADNGFPPNKLAFDPEELTDRELVEHIRGMKVTWWNTLASSTETGVIGNKVSIEHVFNDDSAKRLVKFIDHGGHGFRAFHASALLKVG